MLTIWELQAPAETERFCAEHYSETSEQLDPRHLKLFRSDECPYDEYHFVRIELTPQIINRGSGTQTISSRCISYVLWAKDPNSVKYKIIPILRDMANLRDVNGVLAFRLNDKNLLKYLMYMGHVISNPPFYFLYRLSQLNALTSNTDKDKQERAINAVKAAFPVQPNGDISVSVKRTAYPLLGSAVEVEIPCLYRGALFISSMKLSEDGTPEMQNDRPLQVEGLFDDEPNYNYYPLDLTPNLSAQLEAHSRKSSRAHNWTVQTLIADTFLQLWVLPLFVFHLFVMLVLGTHGVEISNYFDRLKDSTLLYLTSSILGGIGLVIAVFRYGFLELTNYLRKLVPSTWSYIAAGIESSSKQQLAKLGYPMFLLIMTLEHSLKILMALSLTLYACAWVGALGPTNLNFGQAIATVLANIPMAGSQIEKLLASTPIGPVKIPGSIGTVIAAVTGFLFSTVFVGLLTRLFLLTREKNQ